MVVTIAGAPVIAYVLASVRLVAWLLVGQGVNLTVVPYALAAGVVIHIAGDMPTVQGCPWGWPWSQKQVGPPWKRFTTNDGTETAIGYGLWVSIGAMLFFHLGLPSLIGQAISTLGS